MSTTVLQYHAAMAPKARKVPALGTSEGDATGDIADDVGVAVRRARGGLSARHAARAVPSRIDTQRWELQRSFEFGITPESRSSPTLSPLFAIVISSTRDSREKGVSRDQNLAPRHNRDERRVDAHSEET